MERINHLLLIMAFLLASLCGNAEEKLQLKLQEGQRIRFSYTHSSKSYEPPFNFSRTEDEIWETELLITQMTDENHLLIDLMPKRYISNERSGFRNGFRHFDSTFSPLYGNDNLRSIPGLSATIVCSLNIPMLLNLQTNELTFRNMEKLRDHIDQIIKAEKIRPEFVNSLKEEVLHNINEISRFTKDYLLRFHNASFSNKDSAMVSGDDVVVSRSGKMIKLVSKQTTTSEGRPEERTEETKINAGNGLIQESVLYIFHPGYTGKANQAIPDGSEKIIYRLDSDSETRITRKTTVSGYIEHPSARRVHIQFLDDPAGTELRTITVFLDSTNRFSVTIPLKREGFLFLSNTYNENHPWNNETQLIYTEPGDQISFELKDRSDKRTLTHKGDRIAENNFLISQMPVFTLKGSFIINNKKKSITYGVSLPFLLSGSFGGPKNLDDYDDFILTDQLKGQLANSDLSFRFRNYFLNEIAMGKLDMATSIQYSLQAFPETEKDDEMKKIYFNLKMFTDTFQVYRHYNEYGYFSRKAIVNYANFLYNTCRKTFSNPFSHIVPSADEFPMEKDHFTEFLDLILAGSPLMREKVGVFTEMLKLRPPYSITDPENIRLKNEQIYHDLLNNSRDSLLNDFLKTKYNHALEFNNGSVFSRKILLNEAGDSVAIHDFTGGKPVILCIAGDWAASRISLDELAEKHPEATFIFLVGGNNFDVWKDYLSRANAKAIQLFMPSNNYSLQELFVISGLQTRLLVFDIHGKLIGQTSDYGKAESFIVQALNPPSEKKELNKSTLLWMTAIMGALVLLFAAALVSFKYRVRKKMKKQEQEKRLRELELTAIRSQMNPHFLFNSLNSIQNLIRQNRAAEANLYLSDFAGIIRKVMRNSEKEEISLAGELELVDQYLRVEKLRFDFEYSIQVEDQVDAPHFMIPPLLIQPFAENALIHGLQHKSSDRRLQIGISKEGSQIKIVIEDNGIGREAAEKQETAVNGKGIKMNTERLKILQEKYGGTYSIRIIDLAEEGKTGTRVEIFLPDEE